MLSRLVLFVQWDFMQELLAHKHSQACAVYADHCTLPLVPLPWMQTPATPCPLQRTYPGPQDSFLRTQWHCSTHFLCIQGTRSQVLQTGNTEFETPLRALAQVMQENNRQSLQWPFYSKPLLLQEMGWEGTSSSNSGLNLSSSLMSTSRNPKSFNLLWSLSMDCCRYLPN